MKDTELIRAKSFGIAAVAYSFKNCGGLIRIWEDLSELRRIEQNCGAFIRNEED